MKQKALSSKQERMLAFIRQFLGEGGYPPTVRDIVRGRGLRSTSVVDYNLTLLERGGAVACRPSGGAGKARGGGGGGGGALCPEGQGHLHDRCPHRRWGRSGD